ncbi:MULTISPECIES: type II secretion system protein GspM [unclassified Bradyrhizobium]|uniref:type II secretion system protein GspM n=1 Tax=unclassified Bradyrhizobium TaxID=2631580 RepID=UPI0028E51559|nr:MULTISPECIES: type II secretion system protein GspM [unclassified Bradyrhizobium]
MKALQRIDVQLRRRVLFILGNLAILFLIARCIILPIEAVFADREARIADQSRRLAHLNAIVAQASSIESFVSDTNLQVQNGEFLSGVNENVVGADLQTKLKSMTEAAGARSRSVQTLPARTIGQLKYSGVRIDLTAPLPALMRAVYAIESSKPYLFVFAASLKSSTLGLQSKVAEPVLQAQLDVYGATLTGGQP